MKSCRDIKPMTNRNAESEEGEVVQLLRERASDI
jgi:hypothetical protein